ncbi:MAG: hypothetical protein P8Y36_06420 [Alphaproteobacteria bacterium]
MSNVPAIFSNEARAKKYMADLYVLASDIGSFDGNCFRLMTAPTKTKYIDCTHFRSQSTGAGAAWSTVRNYRAK